MNARQLQKLGIPEWASGAAIRAVQGLSQLRTLSKPELREQIRQVAESPALFLGDAVLEELAQHLLESCQDLQKARVQADYQTLESEIDSVANQQMLDVRVRPRIPIGGVLAIGKVDDSPYVERWP